MSKQPTIVTLTSSFGSQGAINDNFEAIQDHFDNFLSLDGSSPNAMSADLDMGSNDLLNVGTVNATTMKIGGTTVVASTAVPSWQGAWTTSTSYMVNDLVREDGSAYICVEAHTSGTFSTDLSASKWELLASKGTAGAGTGDLLAANNLSDLANSDTALSNLGGGTDGITVFKSTSGINSVAIGNTTPAAGTFTNVTVQGDIIHDGDADNKVSFGTDTQNFQTGGSSRLDISDSGVRLGGANARVTTILDEDTMSSDSATSLATQQSIKAYIDSISSRRFISSTDLSNNSVVSFTGFDSSLYDAYEFDFANVVPSSDGVGLRARTSTDGGSTYDSSSSDYGYSNHYLDGAGDVNEQTNSGAAFLLLATSVGSAAGEDGVSGTLRVHGPHLSKKTGITGQMTYINSDGLIRSTLVNGFRLSSADVDAIQFLFGTGNLESGTITMYGLRNS